MIKLFSATNKKRGRAIVPLFFLSIYHFISLYTPYNLVILLFPLDHNISAKRKHS